MDKIYEQLKERFNMMSQFSHEFCALEISKTLRKKFYDVVGSALTLNSKLLGSRHWDSEIKYDISVYLLLCEECIDGVGVQVPYLHCRMRSTKETFSNERHLIMSFLYGKLHDSMFI